MIRFKIGGIALMGRRVDITRHSDGREEGYSSPSISVVVEDLTEGLPLRPEDIWEDYWKVCAGEEHSSEHPCWCWQCRQGAGLLRVEETRVSSTGWEPRSSVQYVYWTGSGHGGYHLRVSDWGDVTPVYTGSLRSLCGGAEYALLKWEGFSLPAVVRSLRDGERAIVWLDSQTVRVSVYQADATSPVWSGGVETLLSLTGEGKDIASPSGEEVTAG